jgi:hypothetical protein
VARQGAGPQDDLQNGGQKGSPQSGLEVACPATHHDDASTVSCGARNHILSARDTEAEKINAPDAGAVDDINNPTSSWPIIRSCLTRVSIVSTKASGSPADDL